MSKGTYSRVRALSAAPLAASYDERFVPYVPPVGTAAGFVSRQPRATTVLRWEYAPGSSLFAVWARDSAVGNTLTLKASYWIGR